jgi:O-antigen ligase
MTFLWIALATLVAVVWVLSLMDLFRRRYPTGTTIAWLALIVILPVIGSAIYWTARKPTAEEIEHDQLAQAEHRRTL